MLVSVNSTSSSCSELYKPSVTGRAMQQKVQEVVVINLQHCAKRSEHDEIYVFCFFLYIS